MASNKGGHSSAKSKGKSQNATPGFWASMAPYFWTIMLIMFVRWALVEPFKIPSPSMVPTLLVGDHLFVSKTAYDLRVPFTQKSVIRLSEPKRGDVVVFEYPNGEEDPMKKGVFFIKRLIAIPGDEISVIDGFPVINGESAKIEKISLDTANSEMPGFSDVAVDFYKETLPGQNDRWHWVRRKPERIGDYLYQDETQADCQSIGTPTSIVQSADGTRYRPLHIKNFCSFVVPEDHYFFMGDNREDSSDGRVFGLVHRKFLKGKALFIWLSLPSRPSTISNYSLAKSMLEFFPDFGRLFISRRERLSRVGLRIR